MFICRLTAELMKFANSSHPIIVITAQNVCVGGRRHADMPIKNVHSWVFNEVKNNNCIFFKNYLE